MRNLKLTIAYDGTDLHGWQVQPGKPTVQGILMETLQRLTQEPVVLHGAGRTDAGVHAWGQVASFQTGSRLGAEEYLRALNAMLPQTIRVRAVEEVVPDFHARWTAQAKSYQYRLWRGRVVPPFCWRYVLHDPLALDFAAMSDAARHFEGHHDFSTFAASTGSDEEDQERVMTRTVFASEWTRDSERAQDPAPLFGCGGAGGEQWTYTIRGQSFLRNMVRKIVGTLLEVGKGRRASSDIPGLLARRDRTCSGPTAPPHGLCLMSVEYPDAAERSPADQSIRAA